MRRPAPRWLGRASWLAKPGLAAPEPPPNRGCLAALGVVSPDAEMQLDPAALPLDLVDLALAVLLAARLERQHLRVLREVLQPSQHLSNGHSQR